MEVTSILQFMIFSCPSFLFNLNAKSKIIDEESWRLKAIIKMQFHDDEVNISFNGFDLKPVSCSFNQNAFQIFLQWLNRNFFNDNLKQELSSTSRL